MILFNSKETDILPYGSNIRVITHSQPEKPEHYHDFNELVIINGGSCTHLLDGRTYTISRGDIFLLTPGCRHAYLNPNNLVLTNILYTTDALDLYKAKLEKLPGYIAMFQAEPSFRASADFKARMKMPPDELEELDRIVFNWEEEMRTADENKQFLSELYLLQVILFCIKRFGRNQKKDDSRDLLLLCRMQQFVNEHYQDDISRDDIVGQASLSVGTATKLFNQYLSQSPMQYLMNVRLNHACELLQKTSNTITTIALDCGFMDSNYFSLQFHRHIGMTPREYRHRQESSAGKAD
ncbi:MAG: helix-turn-helix domain-containing protein [Lentisphaeria bacterium]|nr:helix-turn-helix domain-containing protein [Lentisphaeria bacterium]